MPGKTFPAVSDTSVTVHESSLTAGAFSHWNLTRAKGPAGIGCAVLTSPIVMNGAQFSFAESFGS